ncbi:MAG: hypothetical protein VX686_04180, partial [Candidatus Thermoplasmatota archaeon]|nr:hypothetical protein [Candidatus Thermoplasmatota archaeon]
DFESLLHGRVRLALVELMAVEVRFLRKALGASGADVWLVLFARLRALEALVTLIAQRRPASLCLLRKLLLLQRLWRH